LAEKATRIDRFFSTSSNEKPKGLIGNKSSKCNMTLRIRFAEKGVILFRHTPLFAYSLVTPVGYNH
jgi:hypothetical protein